MDSKKKKKYLEAYISSREVEHRRAFTPPPGSSRIELPTLTVKRKVPRTNQGGGQGDRLPIRDMALKRANYLRPDRDQEERPPSVRDPRSFQNTSNSFRYRRRKGFKLVKDGMERRSYPKVQGKPRKRLSLYDLYATHSEEEPAHVEEHADEHDLEGVIAHKGEPEPVTGAEDMDVQGFRKEAHEILFGPKHKKGKSVDRTHASEVPILKEGPERSQGPDEEVMDAGAIMESEHGSQEVRESLVGPLSKEGHVHQEEAEAMPSLEEKTAHGKICPACGEALERYNALVVCNGCGATGCTSCNKYDQEHLHSNVFYDYKFDHPLCISCYDRAFSIQKLLGKAQMCYGNGNLTYALYYSQNALKMDPEGKYAGSAQALMERIQEARERRTNHDLKWRNESKRLSRSKFQDPAWKG